MMELVYESFLGAFFILLLGSASCAVAMAIKEHRKRKLEKHDKERKNFEKERENWASLLDDRQNAIGDLISEINRLNGTISDLKKALEASEKLRLGK